VAVLAPMVRLPALIVVAVLLALLATPCLHVVLHQAQLGQRSRGAMSAQLLVRAVLLLGVGLLLLWVLLIEVLLVGGAPQYGASSKTSKPPRVGVTCCPCSITDIHMPIELSKPDRDQAIDSIQRYFREYMDEPIGNVTAGALLGFFLEEIGPSLYNRGVADAQQRLQARVAELDFEVHEDEFRYWRKQLRRDKAGR